MPPPVPRLRATVLGAFLEGWRRALRAPAITLGVAVLTLLAVLPLAVVLKRDLAEHLGSSLAAEQAEAGWDRIWTTEFAAGARGIGRTFTFEILGFGGTLASVSRLVDNEPLEPALRAAVAVYLVLWIFLSGGVVDRFARGRPVRAWAFFAACGGHAGRLLRLALLSGACYWALFRWFRPLLFEDGYRLVTGEATAETTRLAVLAGLYVVFVAALLAVSVVSDFARVRAVVEDRRSMVAAVASAIRFIRRAPLRVAGLYLLNILALLVCWRQWLQVAPGAGAADWTVLLLGQLFALARVWARLAFIASEVVFFQGELAHARYTAAPAPIWPDSPAVEAIRNLER